MNTKEILAFIKSVLETNTAQIIIGGITIFALVIVLRRIIRSFFKRTRFIDDKKEKTIESMLNSVIKYVATIGFIFYILSVFEIEVGSMLAGAGVLGIVIGFGAQSLMKDLFAGIFLLYEKQLQQGDWIKVNHTFEGLVEEIGFRVIKVRQWSGTLVTISSGQIQTIENYNMNKMRVIESVTVSFYEDPKKIFLILEQTCERLNQELGSYLKKDLTGSPIEPFTLYGMGSLNDNYRGYQYTITGLCEDLVYFTAAKETRRMMAEAMFEHGIQMAEQHIDMRTNDGNKE
ncbi:putative MscS family protein YfkC [Paraliobacillus sp. PM-2]|uniref:mechanosensitive ion channel family protein n=1 Tax=Paraliobacillus sp. PM-2 TaxID=1462524 RepID=UPI00061BCA89|nr:mechanosensitive ion channel family protein [Paraliobacillus sp. PM-2]CQR47271.1 putative MscS family protein YfkC [Paraliobacillus sp. PM-2]